ncbi:MAG TPA: nucleotidyltransferase domain-containing protein [Pyrinomonadaceae bacterium]|nr:nucleotidyltransferase domain-containing protein [Pyrinomonadaceae bacterium]
MNSKTSLDGLIEITNEILRTKYPSAEFAFLAGSIVRGEATTFSDLDIVIIYKDLANAFRESFYFQNFPVEAFVHTPETLNYFFEADAKSGVPSLAVMVSEGREVPAKNDLSEKLKCLANDCLNNPPKISEEEIRNFRCWITDLIDDVREPRSKEELTASGTTLYAALADFYLRTNGVWSAKSKSIPRSLQKLNPDFYQEFCESFEELFVWGKSVKVIKLAEIILEKHGGFLFDGVRLDAPADWQKPIE